MKFKEVTLGEISIDNKGSYGIAASAVEYSKDLYTYLRITDINDDGTLNKDELKSVNDSNSYKYLLKPNDIVFARTGGSTGRSYFYDGSDGIFVYAGFLIKFSLDPTKVNPKYLKYYTLSNVYKDWITSFNSGSTRGNINAQTYANMKLLLPDYKQQNLLVNTLSCLDDMIELNNRTNKVLEEMAQAIFKRWFIDFEFPDENGTPYKSSAGAMEDSELGEIPVGWRVGTLGESCNLISRGITPIYDENTNEIILNQKCIRNNSIDISLARKHKPKTITEKWVKYGDILINSTGTGTLGRVAQIYFTTQHMTVDSHITIVRPISKSLIVYLGSFISSQQSVIENMASGSTGQTELSRERVKNINVVIPPDYLLSLFSELIEPMKCEIIQLQTQNQSLKDIRDLLLPKLMSGEIRVPVEEG